MTTREESEDLGDAFDAIETFLLGAAPHLTRVEVAERAGVPLEVAQELWRLLGFAHVTDEVVAFTDSDVHALRLTSDLVQMGILGADSQAALVRTWGRSYARLAEWQTSLLAGLAVEGPHPEVRLAELVTGVLPRVEALQSYVWRRHLTSAASRLLTTGPATDPERTMAVCFVDIVGYTTHSKSLEEDELVAWIENFEQVATGTVVDHGGRVIKTIGDEIMFTADDPVAAIEIALALTERGLDDDDPFPAVRAGVAFGLVVNRLGDVFGSTVNVASRLTSVARPGTVVVDRGTYAVLSGDDSPANGRADHDTSAEPDLDTGPERERESRPDPDPSAAGHPSESESDPDSASGSESSFPDEHGSGSPDDHGGREQADPTEAPYRFRRLRRVSVKGYKRLEAWRVRRAKDD